MLSHYRELKLVIINHSGRLIHENHGCSKFRSSVEKWANKSPIGNCSNSSTSGKAGCSDWSSTKGWTKCVETRMRVPCPDSVRDAAPSWAAFLRCVVWRSFGSRSSQKTDGWKRIVVASSVSLCKSLSAIDWRVCMASSYSICKSSSYSENMWPYAESYLLRYWRPAGGGPTEESCASAQISSRIWRHLLVFCKLEQPRDTGCSRHQLSNQRVI